MKWVYRGSGDLIIAKLPILNQQLADKQFQLEEFKQFLDPCPKTLPDYRHQLLVKCYEGLFSTFYGGTDKIDRVSCWGVHNGMSRKNDYPIPGRTNYACYGTGTGSPSQLLLLYCTFRTERNSFTAA